MGYTPKELREDFRAILDTLRNDKPVVLAASTHAGEEALIATAIRDAGGFPLIVPRHAERRPQVTADLQQAGFTPLLRTSGEIPTDIPANICYVADTTGELAGFIKSSDIVIMGKTLAGNDEGQNIIEPAVMGKPIISGPKLKNFRQALDALKKNNAVRIVENESQLVTAMTEYLQDPEKAKALGNAAQATILSNRGALQKTLDLLVESVK
jgi:3-deoxy-D-manno-octulosonic-acid transferase